MTSLVKIASLLTLTSLLVSCASSNDAYRGHGSSVSTLAERDRDREIAISAGLTPAFGMLSPLIAWGVNSAIKPKDPATTAIPSASEKTTYLQPVASSKVAAKTTSDQNGTTYLEN